MYLARDTFKFMQDHVITGKPRVYNNSHCLSAGTGRIGPHLVVISCMCFGLFSRWLILQDIHHLLFASLDLLRMSN